MKTMDKNDILKKVGHISQLAGINPINYTQGKAKGLSAFEVYNAAGLKFTVTVDKCLDISTMTYKGINLGFVSKNGLVEAKHFNALDAEFNYYWSGGLLGTCGLMNTGPSCTEGGFYRTEHGRMSMLPAANVSHGGHWQGNDYILSLSGEVNESMVYGYNLRFERQMTLGLNSKELKIEDTLENLEPSAEEFMLLYHCNFGYPFVDSDIRVVKPEAKVRARLPEFEKGLPHWGELGEPIDGGDEEVFIHENKKGLDGLATAAIINDRLGIGVYLKYSLDTLPLLVQWKSRRSHDYTMALEPSNTNIMGRKDEKQNGTMAVIGGYEKLRYTLIIGVLEGEKEIAEYCKSLQN